jgi:predicted RNA-binding protein
MTYWLCITNEENWNVVKEKNIWGVAERHKNTIAKVKKGDTLLMYLKQEKIGNEKKESRIAGVYEAASAVYTDDKRIFKVPKGMGNEAFPLRIKLTPIQVFKKPVEFKPLIPKLNFITNKKKWAGHLMGKAMRTIPEEDFELIKNRVKE